MSSRPWRLVFPPSCCSAPPSYFLEGISRPQRVMAINLTMLPFNGLLAWAWVGGHFGLPALGAVGAAYATATISWLGAAGDDPDRLAPATRGGATGAGFQRPLRCAVL